MSTVSHKPCRSSLCTLAAAIAVALLGSASSVRADDVDFYLLPPPEPVPPNVLFILDKSGSMNSSNRWQDVRDSMTTLLESSIMDDVKAGIFTYTTKTPPGNNGPLRLRVKSDFAKVGDNRASMLTSINGNKLQPKNGDSHTPTVKAMESAMAWFESGFEELEDGAVVDTFGSPLEHWCAPNHMVLLSDGTPNSNSTTSGERYGLSSYKGQSCLKNGSTQNQNGRCAFEIAEWGYTNDLRTGADWPYDQNVTTHTVAMGSSIGSAAKNWLEKIATKGGGNYYTAQNPDDLLVAFEEIADEAISEIEYTFSAPVIPFSATNAAVSGEFVYVPLFKPEPVKLWQGNLKKYKVVLEDSGELDVKGSNGLTAVGPTGAFLENAKNYWAAEEDGEGDDPLAGGASHRFPAAETLGRDALTLPNQAAERTKAQYAYSFPLKLGTGRNILTYIGDAADLPKSLVPDPTDLLDPVNLPRRVHDTNPLITRAMVDASNDTERRILLNWLNVGQIFDNSEDRETDWDKSGYPIPHTPLRDQKSGSRPVIDQEPMMGGSLHGVPLQVRYDGFDDLVFLNSTQGLLHAFNETSGTEKWAFMPQELLNTIKKGKNNGGTSGSPLYGLDGSITFIHDDVDEDNKVDVTEDALLVLTMRRGGRNIYALDVSNPRRPELRWQINGGTGDFVKLGQTWSKPQYGKIKQGGVDGTKVLVFGGGYDEDQDDVTGARQADDIGNYIYIVDASNGSLIKSIGPDGDIDIDDMTNSIAADVTFLDIDHDPDGFKERIYAADVGGRVIRVDIEEGKGGVLADINGGGSASDNRRFFNAPAVAYTYDNGRIILAVVIGSGNRPDPLANTVDDRFYMIKDQDVTAAPASYPGWEKDDFVDITDRNLIPNGEDLEERVEVLTAIGDSSNGGWSLDLEEGEKALSSALVFDHAVMFTAYSGERATDTDVCKATSVDGLGRFYALDLRHGGSILDLDGDGDIDEDDRALELQLPGLPPPPNLFVAPASGDRESNVMVIVGFDKVVDLGDEFEALFWQEIPGYQ